ncbi:unnamed protein product [Calypogeia fissa]
MATKMVKRKKNPLKRNGNPRKFPHHRKSAVPHVDEKESASEEETGLILEDNATAYNSLLQSLQAKGGSFADAYAQRKREERGASSSDEEDEREEHEVDAVNSDEGSEDEADGADEQHPTSTPIDKEIESGKETVDAIKNEVPLDDDNDQVHSQSEDESEEDVNEAQVASGEQAGICPGSFKTHVERVLVDDEIAQLVQAKQKFSRKVPASGVQGGSWIFNTAAVPKNDKNLSACGVKKRLQDCWKGLYRKPTWGDFGSEQQCQFFSLCNSYLDILNTNKFGNDQDTQEDLSIMDAYVFHILNHITKTRDLITKDNEKLQRATLDGTSSDPPRDQGFTRPKVLVLLPFRSSALKFVDRLLKLAPASQKSNVEHKARFFDDFGVEEDNTDGENEEDPGKKETKSGKPADFRALFKGNNDDHFRIGIKFTRNSIKLYSEFYSSDIIIASPVGLITRIGEAEMEKGKDIDFLSSIEIAVIDYTDVILMQNWSHVVSVFDRLNKIPAQQHGTDFMRIREWYLNGHAPYYRQTIIVSAFPDAGVNAMFHRACVNYAGKVKIRCEYEGVLAKVVLQVRQVYEKIDCSGITDVDDARFEFFVKQIFPKLKNSFQDGTMIFIRSYFDFVRLRNFLKSQSASFCLLGEYTKQSDVSRARSWFYHGTRKILLYTERAHFFHRYKVRGIKDLIFYSLPDHANFYLEMLNLLEGKESPSCTILFSRFDNLQLERIVGTSRSQKILASPNKLFMFC